MKLEPLAGELTGLFNWVEMLNEVNIEGVPAMTSVVAQIFLDYKRYVAVLKWLTLSLFAYVAALAFAHVSWT